MQNNLAHKLDFANHHPDAVSADIDSLCHHVEAHGFNAAFVNPSWVSYIKNNYPHIKIGTIVSFPLGQETLDIKLASIKNYAQNGANELDTALNVSYLKNGQTDQSLDEMKRLVHELKTIDESKIIKLVPETGYLNPEELKRAAQLIVESGADFIKTNTGMGPISANVDECRLIKSVVGDAIKIKVAGGVSNTQEANDFFSAGASRIGTSHALEIIDPNHRSSPTQPHSTINE